MQGVSTVIVDRSFQNVDGNSSLYHNEAYRSEGTRALTAMQRILSLYFGTRKKASVCLKARLNREHGLMLRQTFQCHCTFPFHIPGLDLGWRPVPQLRDRQGGHHAPTQVSSRLDHVSFAASVDLIWKHRMEGLPSAWKHGEQDWR